MHVVAVVALDRVVGFDLATACQVFATASLPDGRRAYEVRVCAPPGVTATAFGSECFGVQSRWGLDDVLDADTIVVPGHANFLEEPPAHMLHLLALLRRATSRGARIVSICTGAFVLAAAGLLDGRRATTHWRHAPELARRYPEVMVDPAVLFVDDGQLVTSAGLAAGLDMCLHLVRRDHGAAVAAGTARYVVMPMQRGGGQAQFSAFEDGTPGGPALRTTLDWMERNLDRQLTLEDLARQQFTSVRTLSRRFRALTGTTPLQWLLRARVRRAQQLLETTDLPVERVAELAGLGSSASLRSHLKRVAGTSPQAYRLAFRDAAGEEKTG
jgi:transcriptional regulator GlxA family with amidase domain